MLQAIQRSPSTPNADEAALQDQRRSFLRMVSHELRTPLNSILGFSEILASEMYGPLGTPQYREYAEIIQDSGARLLRLVNQVLELSRLEAGLTDLALDPVPLGPAIDDALTMVRDELMGRSLRPTVDEDQHILVVADERGLRTILANLLQNAAAFSPHGGEVRLSIVREDGEVAITVEDDGEGVAPEALTRLLRPFEQGEDPLSRRSAGAGLGLAICDMTCRAMGGRLALSSPPGRGLVVRMTLPAG